MSDKTMELALNEKLHDVLEAAIRHGAEYESESARACNDSGCWPCHHNVVANTRITHADAFKVAQSFLDMLDHYKVKRNPLMDYCMSRLITSTDELSDPSSWEVIITHGWYGEETGGVRLVNREIGDKLREQLRALLHQNDRERMETVLLNEYSFLIDSLKNIKTYEVQELPFNFVIADNKTWQNRLSKKKVDAYRKYFEDADEYNRKILPVGLIQNGALLDGFHRHAGMNLFLRENPRSNFAKNCPFVVAV